MTATKREAWLRRWWESPTPQQREEVTYQRANAQISTNLERLPSDDDQLRELVRQVARDIPRVSDEDRRAREIFQVLMVDVDPQIRYLFDLTYVKPRAPQRIELYIIGKRHVHLRVPPSVTRYLLGR